MKLCWTVVTLLVTGWILPLTPAYAQPDDPLLTIWARTDRPVAQLQVTRSWLWGPQPFTSRISELYQDATGGQRTVIYYDKGRLEMGSTDASDGIAASITSGLLVNEMITGQLQLGDSIFEQRKPASINVAGDPNGESSPTYATFSTLIDAPPAAEGETIIQRVARDGTVIADAALAQYGVMAAYSAVESGIDHQVASVFWTFMTSRGLVEVDGYLVEQVLFPDPFAATGLPITEPYWTTVEVGQQPRLVLVQLFQRRVLTWTPDNPEGWQVESGNDGQHYFLWRYGYLPHWQELVFSSTRGRTADDPWGSNLFAVKADGTNLHQMTALPGNDTEPAWSPDGTRIAFLHAEPDFSGSRVFVMNADGSEVMPITNLSLDGSVGRSIASHPVWSPDGASIAFIGSIESEIAIDTALFTVQADGPALTRLTPPSMLLSSLAPAWSPDGTQIAFSADGVYVVNSDGSSLIQLSGGHGPTWSPDGSRISYVDSGLFVMDSDGTSHQRLSDLNVFYSPATWSPDGSQLAVFAVQTGMSQIFVVDAETGAYEEITASAPGMGHYDILPVWSADGTKIAFTRLLGDIHEVVVVNADGSGEWNVSNSPESDFEPAWRPIQ